MAQWTQGKSNKGSYSVILHLTIIPAPSLQLLRLIPIIMLSYIEHRCFCLLYLIMSRHRATHCSIVCLRRPTMTRSSTERGQLTISQTNSDPNALVDTNLLSFNINTTMFLTSVGCGLQRPLSLRPGQLPPRKQCAPCASTPSSPPSEPSACPPTAPSSPSRPRPW